MVSLRALAPSLTRITVAGAVGAAFHVGQGDCDLIDAKAVEFSRAVLKQTDVEGEVICCEGPKDHAPAFERREKVGTGNGPAIEFIVDPVDGTTAASKGRKDAISAFACAPTGCFQVLPDDGYYFKIATDHHSIGKLSMDMSTEEIVRTIAKAKNVSIEKFTVIMLERDSHNDILKSSQTDGRTNHPYPRRRHCRRNCCSNSKLRHLTCSSAQELDQKQQLLRQQ